MRYTFFVRRLASVLIPLLFAAAIFLPGIDWGLPSREADKYLFATSRPWTGEQILELLEAAQREGEAPAEPADARFQPAESRIRTGSARASPSRPLGADVDATPILDRSKPIVLNDTDAKRAAIVQRYRLMSGQPDEFIQFKALAEMAARPGIHKLDPRLYQYGGLWIYPVGALLYAGDMLGVVELKSDRAYYLDHPEKFGRFYVVARCYSAAWGLVAVACVGWITHRVTRNRSVAALAACAFALLPVVMTAAQEAKPHLAGCALVLLTVIAATRFVETDKRRRMLLASVLAGAAPAMVLSMVWAVAVLPVMILSWHGFPTRDRSATGWKPVPRLLVCLTIAFLTYAVTNPFVLYNALFAREAITSNLGNSTAMYGIRDLPRAVVDATRIFTLGATPVVVIGAVVGGVVLVRSAIKGKREGEAPAEPALTPSPGTPGEGRGEGLVPDSTSSTAQGSAGASPSQHTSLSHDASPRRIALVLLATPALFALLTFIALAAGKPAEYARFSLLVAATAVVVAAGGASVLPKPRGAVALIVVAVLVAGTNLLQLHSQTMQRVYWRSIARYEGFEVFGWLRQTNQETLKPLLVYYEPATWSLPPVDLFSRQIVLLPRDQRPNNGRPAFVPANLASQVGMDWVDGSVSWRNSFIVDATKTPER